MPPDDWGFYVTAFRRKQRALIVGAFLGFIVVALTFEHASELFASISQPSDDVSGRLVFALHWMLLPAICLLVGVIVAGRRGFIPNAIDGTRTPENPSLEINLRYNQNTLEQTVLACIAWACAATDLPTARLVLIPAAATLFAVGRLTFWVGYLIHPEGRAFGMVLTVAPTLGSYIWLIWHAATYSP